MVYCKYQINQDLILAGLIFHNGKNHYLIPGLFFGLCNETNGMKRVTSKFLAAAEKGVRLFKFSEGSDGTGEDYVMYSVIGRPADGILELEASFDEKEKKVLAEYAKILKE